EPVGVASCPVDVRPSRGRGADQQLHGAVAASRGVVAEAELRQQQPGRLSLRGTHLDHRANAAVAGEKRAGVLARRAAGSSLRPTLCQIAAGRMNGYYLSL